MLARAKPEFAIPEVCRNFVNGQWVISSVRLPVINPVDEQVLTEIAEADTGLVDEAVRAARLTFEQGVWSKLGLEDRQKVLFRIADLIDEHADELAWLESMNIGSPLSQCRGRHVPRAAYNFRFFAEYISQSRSDAYTQLENYLSVVTREPVGVAALIGPWNAPIALTSMKIAAALAFGNSCVVKPSEISPLTAVRMVELIRDSGVPDGVVNLVNGSGAVTGAALASHPDIDVLSFTGGTTTGRAIMSAAGKNLTPVTLELGGKSANIIFDDADFDRALDGALISIFSNNGQQCLAGSRILLQEGIAEKFMDAFIQRTRNLKIGDPLLPETEVGPLATKQHFERVHSFVDTLEADGCKLLVGGKRCSGFDKGFYYEPTAVLAPDNSAVVCQEEIFGPFAAFQLFKTPQEAWDIANDSKFGLLGYVWTSSYATAMAAHETVKSGVLCINSPIIRELRAPFGGYKESGVGRESGAACEAFYSEVKTTAFLTGDVPLRKLGLGEA
ncbi:MAG: aldehyde dehydrogenase [Hyphomonas sp.]|uniref:aldehyde dehydrogenase n=1 Tax=Hyphomonas sp. TaxID=87 RepID=UPI0032644E2D